MSGKISQMIQEMKNAEDSDGSAPECLKHVGRHNPIPGLLRLHGLECLPHQGFLLQTIEPSGAKAPCSHGGPQRHVVVCHLNVIRRFGRIAPSGSPGISFWWLPWSSSSSQEAYIQVPRGTCPWWCRGHPALLTPQFPTQIERPASLSGPTLRDGPRRAIPGQDWTATWSRCCTPCT